MNIVKVLLDGTSHDIFLPTKRQEETACAPFVFPSTEAMRKPPRNFKRTKRNALYLKSSKEVPTSELAHTVKDWGRKGWYYISQTH